MPGGDGTGPMGAGPITGRGDGYCVLRIDEGASGSVSGVAGVDGKRVDISNSEEVTQMPAGDGTGPMGTGPMTGRAAGFCAGNSKPGYMNPGPGRGLGMGFRQGYGRQVGRGFRGRGRGGWVRRNWLHATGMPGWARADAGIPAWGGYPPYGTAPTREQELDDLKSQAEYFQSALEDIKTRTEELKAGSKAE